MDRLRGRSLAAHWAEVADPVRIARTVGECLSALHDVDTALEDDWATFESEQRRSAAERQRARGLDERWVEQIPAFLEGLDLGGPSVLLHTEVMREHLLVDGDRLSGLFDFEPSRLGPAEYDLASVGLFVSGGDPRLFRAVLEGLGFAGDRAALARRVPTATPTTRARAATISTR